MSKAKILKAVVIILSTVIAVMKSLQSFIKVPEKKVPFSWWDLNKSLEEGQKS